MKRYINVLLGLAIVVTVYSLPDVPLAFVKRVLETVMVVNLCLEVLKRKL
jgi:hypothetical protein